MTKVADDPGTRLSLFDQPELATDEATASALNAMFLGAPRAAAQSL